MSKKTIQIVVTLRYKMFFSALKIVLKKRSFLLTLCLLFILFFCTKTNAEKNFFCLRSLCQRLFFSALDFVQKKETHSFCVRRTHSLHMKLINQLLERMFITSLPLELQHHTLFELYCKFY